MINEWQVYKSGYLNWWNPLAEQEKLKYIGTEL